MALNVNSKLGELYAKRILEKFEKKETSEDNFENKNGSLDNLSSHFCENDKILKEKEAELDHFVHQPPRGGSSNSQFEPTNKNSNSRGFLQSAQPYGSKSQFENGASAPEFEPFAKTKAINPENENIKTEIDETVIVNENVETKNKKRGRPKTKNKTIPSTTQKFSNQIKFIDYIPTNELITYRHLFAYGFYVE